MLYNLLVPWASEWTALNVFRYITFRSMAALITALVLSILLGPRFIAWLRRLKCGQHILHEVTAHACKEGTPTMGGLLMLFSLTVSLLLWADLGNFYIWQTLLVGRHDQAAPCREPRHQRPGQAGGPAGGGRGGHALPGHGSRLFQPAEHPLRQGLGS